MPRKAISDVNVLTQMVVCGIESRGELCLKFGLSKAAITQAINRLIKSGFVEEGRRLNEARRGRKTVSLRFRPDMAYFIGTDLEGGAIRV